MSQRSSDRIASSANRTDASCANKIDASCTNKTDASCANKTDASCANNNASSANKTALCSQVNQECDENPRSSSARTATAAAVPDHDNRVDDVYNRRSNVSKAAESQRCSASSSAKIDCEDVASSQHVDNNQRSASAKAAQSQSQSQSQSAQNKRSNAARE
jgi:hypothetical protein